MTDFLKKFKIKIDIKDTVQWDFEVLYQINLESQFKFYCFLNKTLAFFKEKL